MRLSKKSGITVTSIVVYVILFFAFTTTITAISSRFNRNLFNDRGNAINITAIDKLEYNLLSSAKESYDVKATFNGNVTTITFSNSDVYSFDKDNHVIYKNGGKLVKFVKESHVRASDNNLRVTLTLNKYTNEVTRTINVSIPSEQYYKNGLIAHFDGIDNVGVNKHDNTSAIWKDISQSGKVASLSSNFISDGVENFWREDGLVFIKSDVPNFSHYVEATYNDTNYSSMSFEINLNMLTELGNGGNDYVYPLYIRDMSGDSTSLSFGVRLKVLLMYGSGNNTVLNPVRATGFFKDNNYTFTFVQEGLTARKVYVNGALFMEKTNLSLSDIVLGRVTMRNHLHGAYIIHSVRVYNRALTADEISHNYFVDRFRFGE